MKSYEAFQNQKGIVYIPEAEDQEYTYEDFLDIAGGNVKLAHIIFQLCDWQHPETIVDELEREEEIDENKNIIPQH